MRRLGLILSIMLLGGCVFGANLELGLERLSRGEVLSLEGKRVAIVAHAASVNRDGKNILDLFIDNPKVNVVSIFAPEHGIFSKYDERFKNEEYRGIVVYSLYGDFLKPQNSLLKGVDYLIFDLQDVGSRYYTYISTLALCMKAAASVGVKVVVTDRPNMIGGVRVDGGIAEKEVLGDFTCYYPIPMTHGMTIGELALLFNTEYGINCDLTVIPMKGYDRSLPFDHFGLPFVKPSPNMISVDCAILYSGFGLLEGFNLSVGRGTDSPFFLYGAPWVNTNALFREFSAYSFSGVEIKPTNFKPVSSMYANQVCYGFAITLLERGRCDVLKDAVYIIRTLWKLYPKDIKSRRFEWMIGRKSGVSFLLSRSWDEIREIWNRELEVFLPIRKKYLLYP